MSPRSAGSARPDGALCRLCRLGYGLEGGARDHGHGLRSRLFDRDGDCLAQPRLGVVQVISELQREGVLAWFYQGFECCGTVAEVDLRVSAWDLCTGRQTLGVKADVVMSDATPWLVHFLRHRGDLVVFDSDSN